ncbi:hypothetical protein [Asticcacaulis sp. W401b]|uniref:hypothetical protein n=1 Tax=Asticcacaulis sp. W401b TaxID=3388666 RepID=UPI0039710560
MQRRKLPKVHADALRHCYSGKTIARTTLFEEMEKASRPTPYLCPYCLLRTPRSWDHYFPKDDYPEFSTFALNLVRVCNSCNLRKGNRFVGPVRSVVHPFIDPLPPAPMVTATVHINGTRIALTYEIAPAPGAGVNPQILALMQRHFDALSVAADMAAEGNAMVNTLVNELVAGRNVPFTAEELGIILHGRLDARQGFPFNGCDIATLMALIEAPGFLAHVNSKVNPAAPPPGHMYAAMIASKNRLALTIDALAT